MLEKNITAELQSILPLHIVSNSILVCPFFCNWEKRLKSVPWAWIWGWLHWKTKHRKVKWGKVCDNPTGNFVLDSRLLHNIEKLGHVVCHMQVISTPASRKPVRMTRKHFQNTTGKSVRQHCETNESPVPKPSDSAFSAHPLQLVRPDQRAAAPEPQLCNVAHGHDLGSSVGVQRHWLL